MGLHTVEKLGGGTKRGYHGKRGGEGRLEQGSCRVEMMAWEGQGGGVE